MPSKFRVSIQRSWCTWQLTCKKQGVSITGVYARSESILNLIKLNSSIAKDKLSSDFGMKRYYHLKRHGCAWPTGEADMPIAIWGRRHPAACSCFEFTPPKQLHGAHARINARGTSRNISDAIPSGHALGSAKKNLNLQSYCILVSRSKLIPVIPYRWVEQN